VTWISVAIGILLRLRQYLFGRSLWLDESLISLNIIQRSTMDLLKPLDRAQGAPIGFLWLEKLATYLFGPGELALRLIPLLCGIGSVLLFVKIARRFLPADSAPIAVALFAICEPLIYYSSEVKQYSLDVFVGLALLLLTAPLLDFKLERKEMARVAAAGAVAVWLSHPSIFVLAGIGLTALWIRIHLMKVSIVIGVWLCSFYGFYRVSLASLSQNHALLDYWSRAFAPFPPMTANDLWWYPRAAFGMFRMPGGFEYQGIFALVAVVGGVAIFRERRRSIALLILPVALTLIASLMHRYPFEGRLLLFLAPSVLLLVGAGIGRMLTICESIPVLGPVVLFLLFFHPLMDAGGKFIYPNEREDLRSAIQYVDRSVKNGDLFYCHYTAEASLAYYRSRGVTNLIPTTTGPLHQEWSGKKEDMEKFRGNKRVWILLSYAWKVDAVDDMPQFLAQLESMGKQMDSFQGTGVSAYLYDFSGRDFSGREE